MNADPQPCLHGKNSTGREKEGDPAHTPVGRPDIMSEGFGINTVYKFQCCRAGAGGAEIILRPGAGAEIIFIINIFYSLGRENAKPGRCAHLW